MNFAVLLYTFWLRVRKMTKGDIIFDVITFIGCFGLCQGGAHAIEAALDLALSPLLLILVCWRFATDSVAKDAEYLALLFTRPITRTSYVITKAVTASLGGQLMIWKMLLFMAISEVIMRVTPFVFINGWDALNLFANSISFGCLAVAIYRLPSKWATVAYVALLYAYLGNSLVSTGMKLTGPAKEMSGTLETMRAALYAIFVPSIDLETTFRSTSFSVVPILAFVSNILIYLTVATVLLNKRELSYAED